MSDPTTANEVFVQPVLFEMQPIEPEDQENRGWFVEINQDVVLGSVSEAKIVNESMGIELSYGMRPEGYDGVVIHERGGGGVVTIPYMIHPETKVVYVGLVQEYRPTLGGSVWNVPRGALDDEETHDNAVERELHEETGYKAVASRVVKLATGLNPSSAFFDTSGTNEDGSPEGVSVYGIQVMLDELEVAILDDGATSYVFPRHIQEMAHGDKATEHIFATRFIPVTEAIKSRDMFTSAAAGQLLVELYSGVLESTHSEATNVAS
jgi:8-oxo-dGTP pyrophosphatase MutT (NUDIX family)